MNLIDRDKLIDELKHFYWTAYQPLSAHPCEYDDAVRIVIKQPTVNGWIPVDNELPKNNKKVLIKDADGDVYIARHVNGNWDCLYFAYDYEDVVAWKPIEPYTGDKE